MEKKNEVFKNLGKVVHTSYQLPCNLNTGLSETEEQARTQYHNSYGVCIVFSKMNLGGQNKCLVAESWNYFEH